MIIDRELVAVALPGYDIGLELGRGGCGVVLEASHRQLRRSVAIKQLPRAFGTDPAIRARFMAEARMLASLDHAHIVPVYDFVEHEGVCLLVMEKLTGGTVWDRFQTAGMTMQNACAVALATCSALNYAHFRGVLHRDIKPENLLLSSTSTLKVSDFGIATVLGGERTMVTRQGEILGTPAYMAPEQAQGHTLTPATDVYGVGVMLYELLSGQLPYPDEEPLAVLYRHVNEPPRPLLELAPAVPEGIAVAVMRALAHDADERHQSAEEFGATIFRAATHAWGEGWLGRCDIPVVAAGTMLRVTEPETGSHVGSHAGFETGDPSAAPVAPPGGTAGRAGSGPVVRPTVDSHTRGPSLVGVEEVELLSPPAAASAMRASVQGYAVEAALEPAPGLRKAVTVHKPAPGKSPDGTQRKAQGLVSSATPTWRGRRAAGALVVVLVLAAGAMGVQRLVSHDSPEPARAGPPAPTVPTVPIGQLAWREASDALLPRQQAATAIDQGTIWVLGGLSGNSSTAKVEGYDPAIDTWKSGPDLPVPLHHAMAVSFRGQLVVMGGWIPAGSNLTSVASDRVFGLQGGTWVELPRLNRPRAGGAAAVAKDRLVVVGGQADGKLVTTTEVFDGNRWTDAADIPTPRDHLAAASDEQYVYAIGGRARSADKNLAVLERFDPESGHWDRLADMPTARGGLGAAIVGRQLIAVGGEAPVGVFGTVEGYDFDEGSWVTLPPLPTPRHGLGVVALGSSVYAIDGSPRPTHAESSAITEVLELGA